jgi:carbon-monoxide dehydrogenase small subunit
MAKKTMIEATINGESKAFVCEPRQSLLEVLRDVLFLTGAKEGCNDGNCGSCNVIVDDVLVNACCMLGVEIAGKNVETVESLEQNGVLHPLQRSFLEETGMQCGICTPGFLMSAKALLAENPNPTEEEIRFWLAGTLCRCTGYDKIVRSVMKAAQQLQEV